jgi:hypothetical protein
VHRARGGRVAVGTDKPNRGASAQLSAASSLSAACVCSGARKVISEYLPVLHYTFHTLGSITSFAGLPEMAMRSAYLPFSIDPTRSPQSILSA